MSNISLEVQSPCVGWYALRVRHQNEYKVSDFLRGRFGVQAKVPSREVWKRRDGRKVAVTKPLLSAYVFMEANPEAVETKLMFLHNGVLGFVRSGGSPAVIPNEQLESLERLASSEAPVYDLPYSKLTAGERVRVVNGPLRGALGQFVRMSAATGRFIVTLELFKRALVTELDADFLEPY